MSGRLIGVSSFLEEFIIYLKTPDPVLCPNIIHQRIPPVEVKILRTPYNFLKNPPKEGTEKLNYFCNVFLFSGNDEFESG